jgi:hypothetical protein
VWKEMLVGAGGATSRKPTDAERKKLHRIGDDVGAVTLSLNDGSSD